MGPHILYHDFDGSSALWKFDSGSLCLQINTTHPDFVVVEKSSDYKVKALTEQIFLTAFQLELQDPGYRLHAEKFAQEMVSGFVVLLQKGTVARKVGGK
jgi:predicted membrane metal-binding protein